MSATSALTVVQPNGQITIPDTVREALGIRVGDRIEVVLAEDNQQEATLRRVPSVVESTYGIGRGRRAPLSIEDMDRIAEEESVSNAIDELRRSS
jgi:AbrB family looped-hinge helix DNA binding protein